jgi:hypothetical protein
MLHTLDTYKKFEPSGQRALPQLTEKARPVTEWATSIQPLEKVVSAIGVQLHFFSARAFLWRRNFQKQAGRFLNDQSAVDATLASRAGKAFKKLPYVFERLQNGDSEPISHAFQAFRNAYEQHNHQRGNDRECPTVVEKFVKDDLRSRRQESDGGRLILCTRTRAWAAA